MDMVADDIDILAALGVDAVSVGAAGAVADADVQNVHILRVGRVDGPRVAVADLHTVQHHVFGAVCKEQTGAVGQTNRRGSKSCNQPHQRQIVKDFLIKFTKIHKKGARSTVWLLTPRLIDYIFPFSRSLQRYA